MPQTSRVMDVPLGPNLALRIRDEALALKCGDPLAPVTVVVPTFAAKSSLRRTLGRAGMANVHFLTLADVAQALGGEHVERGGSAPLTHLMVWALVRMAASEAGGPLAPFRDHPSLRRALRSTFHDLARAAPAALERVEAAGGVSGEVVRLHRRYMALRANYFDSDDVATLAAELVEKGLADAARREFGPMLALLAGRLTPAERRLMTALSATGECMIFRLVTGDPDADSVVAGLGASAETGGADRYVPRSASLAILPDPYQEVRWVVRRLLRAAEDGTPFYRMAVLYRQPTPYAALLRDALELAGVPWSGRSVETAGSVAVGRSFVSLLRMVDGDFPRDAVMAWLSGSPALPQEVAAGVSVAEWDAVSRQAGIVKGAAQWHDRLANLARNCEAEASKAEAIGEATESAARLRRQAESARSLARLLVDLSERLHAPGQGATWREYAEWARGLFAGYLPPENDLEGAQAEAHRRIVETLDGVGGLDDLGLAPTPDAFIDTMQEAMAAPLGRPRGLTEGVFLGAVSSAIGLEFDLLHVVGMAEGAFPPSGGDDPLLPDAVRLAASGEVAGLLPRAARAADERYAYLAALAAAPSRVFSFSRSDPAAGRGQFPSRWFLEEGSRLRGTRVFSSGLASLNGEPWFTAVASAEDALRTVETNAPVDLPDRDLHALWRWRRAGRPLTEHHLADAVGLRRPLGIEWARVMARVLGEWDGDVSTVAGRSTRLRSVREGTVSPTSLESWAKCPFRHFLGSVLRVEALEPPEEVVALPPLEKGLLLHDLLEAFVRRALDAGALPAPGASWTAEGAAMLHQLAEVALDAAEGRGITGKPLLWQLEREAILADLDKFLEEDARLRASHGVTPCHLEAWFSGAGDAQQGIWASPTVGALRFRGAIDRVDVSADGKRALVLDYKTGSTWDYRRLKDDPVDGGRKLQLPVYLLAAQAALGADVEVRAAYWFVTAKGKFALAPSQPVSLAQIGPRFGQAVDTIVAGMRDGLFPANPGPRGQYGPEHCGFCPFDRACPSRRERQWQWKRADPRLAAYVRLTESPAPAEEA